MEKFRIQGPTRLEGRVAVSGAKNAALPCLAATILTDDEVVLENLPRTRDIRTMEGLLDIVGERTIVEDGATRIETVDTTTTRAPYDLVKTMRASVLALGPLAASRGRARVALPGGCAIGSRPIEEHLKGLAALGAGVELGGGDVIVEAPDRIPGGDYTFGVTTVGGTENVVMAAVLGRGRSVLSNCAMEPEIVDLCDMLRAMGARIRGDGTPTITIDGVPELGSCRHRIIPDRIEAGTYVLAAVTAGDGVVVDRCRPDHISALLDLLRRAGAEIEVGDEEVRIGGNGLRAVEVTTAEHPGFPTDLQAQLVAALTRADGASTVREKIFENRFQHVPELLRMGARIDVDGSTAVVHGPTPLEGATVMATDLRASASLVIAGLAAEGETVVDRIYHLDRGYETMEEKLAGLGADVVRFNPGPFV